MSDGFQDKPSDCVGCSEHLKGQGFAHHSGSTESSIVAIGEALGEWEARKGLPFCGGTGMMLRKMFEQAGFDPWKDIYVTNIVKCRPWEIGASGRPINRTPENHEILQCTERYLDKELQLLRPKIVIPVGDTALQYVLGYYHLPERLSILEARGYVLDTGTGVLVVPIVHPSYVAQGNSEFWEVTVYDLKKIKNEVMAGAWMGYKDERFNLFPTIGEFEALVDFLIEKRREFSIDLETYPRDASLWKLFIRCFSIAWSSVDAMAIPLAKAGGSSWWSEEYEVRVWVALQKLLNTGWCAKITQNGYPFDAPILEHMGLNFRGAHHDTLTMHLLSYLELPHSLEFLASCFSRRRPFKKMLRGKAGMFWGKAEDVHLYNCRDACATFEIKDTLKDEMISSGCWDMYNDIYLPVQECVLDMQVAGVQIDVNHMKELHKKAGDALVEEETKWQELLGYPLNPNSPAQVRDMFEQDFNVRLGGSADKLHLLKVGVMNPDVLAVARAVLECRDLSKVRGTYLDVELDENNRAHSTMGLRTITLRLTSKDPDIQNLPRIPKQGINVKDIYVAKPGCVLLSRDYSQLEFRIPAYASGCRPLIKMFEEGQNIHTRNACIAFKRTIDKNKDLQAYTTAKTIKFAEGYGATPQTISDHILRNTYEFIDPKFIQSVLESWRVEYHELYAWHERDAIKARDLGYLEDGFGFKRVMFTPKDQRRNTGYAWPTATTASQIMNRSMARYWQSDYRHDLGIQLVMQIHDDLTFEVPEQHLHEADALIKADMEKPVMIFGVGTIVFPTEAKWGCRLSEMKSLTER